MLNWTNETDAKAKIFFDSLTESEIRRRQDLCAQQIKMAYDQKNADALTDLRRMEAALTESMLTRL